MAHKCRKAAVAKPAAGMLLVAAGSLRDPNFIRSVVFLCEHKQEGSFGLILNHPLPVKLSDGFPSLSGWDAPLYRGGPVQASSLHFLHRRGDLGIGGAEVAPGVFWGGDFETLDRLMRLGQVESADFRFFAGYSGWGEGQLDAEIARKDWYLRAAAVPEVFSDEPGEQWRTILRGMGMPYALYANMPPNAQLN